MDGSLKRRHEAKYDTPRVGIRQRELVRNYEKRQPYPGNDGKLRKSMHETNSKNSEKGGFEVWDDEWLCNF